MIKLALGRKVFAVLILENIFKECHTMTDHSYAVHVDKISIDDWNFGVEIELEHIEAKKLLNYLIEIQPKLSLGYRTQIGNKIKDIQDQLYKKEVA